MLRNYGSRILRLDMVDCILLCYRMERALMLDANNEAVHKYIRDLMRF